MWTDQGAADIGFPVRCVLFEEPLFHPHTNTIGCHPYKSFVEPWFKEPAKREGRHKPSLAMLYRMGGPARVGPSPSPHITMKELRAYKPLVEPWFNEPAMIAG
jgi:hypothetical protein